MKTFMKHLKIWSLILVGLWFVSSVVPQAVEQYRLNQVLHEQQVWLDNYSYWDTYPPITDKEV